MKLVKLTCKTKWGILATSNNHTQNDSMICGKEVHERTLKPAVKTIIIGGSPETQMLCTYKPYTILRVLISPSTFC